MNCPFFEHPTTHKHGRTSKGSQRLKCAGCQRTCTETFDTLYYRRQVTAEQIELESWSKQTKFGTSFETPGIIFSPDDAVIPDVIWISHERLAKSVDEPGHLTVAPELIVVAVSPHAIALATCLHKPCHIRAESQQQAKQED